MSAQQSPKPVDVIEMVEEVDPATGMPVFVAPLDHPATSGAETAIRGGSLAEAGNASASESIGLTSDRFAAQGPGFGDEFEQAQRAQDAGLDVRIVGGKMVGGPAGQDEPSESIALTKDRFAGLSPAEVVEFHKLADTGAAERYVDVLQSTGDMREHFPVDPGGVYLRTKPTRLGDVLHVVSIRDPATRLYHAHLWTFEMAEQGGRKVVDLNRYVCQPGLSAHDVHLYPGRNGHGAVLCLSPATRGGMPTLSECVVRCAQWAVGMGEVLRGRPFPYKQ